jgi:hypothetical protein
MKRSFIYLWAASLFFAGSIFAQTNSSNSKTINTVNMKPAEIVNRYLNIIFVENNKGAGLSDLLAEDFVFDDPFTIARGANDFISKAQMWIETKKTYTMEKQFADDSSVCSIYSIDVQTPAGKIETFELSDYVIVQDSKITNERVYFSDPVKFAKAMGFLDNYVKAYQ